MNRAPHGGNVLGRAEKPSVDAGEFTHSGSSSRRGFDRDRRISLYNCVAAFFALDILIIAASGVAASELHYWAGLSNTILADTQSSLIIFALCLHPFITKSFGLYRTDLVLESWRAHRRMLFSLFVTFSLMLTVTVAAKAAGYYSRLWFFGWFGLCAATTLAIRALILSQIRHALRTNAFVYKALSVGIGCEPIPRTEIARKTNNEVFALYTKSVDSFEDLARLSQIVANQQIDRVYIAAPWAMIPALLRKLDLLRHLATQVFVLPADRRLDEAISDVSFLGDRLTLQAIDRPINGWSHWMKRVEDVSIAVVALTLMSPVMLLVALAIKLDSPGPLIFYQMRTGFNGRVFKLRKFRSMYADQSDPDAARQTSRDDPRVTKVGRVIRRLSVDEWPQLINVIEGTMSIVGPRPHALATKTDGKSLEELVDYYAVRHRVKPGLTGWAQVHGYRGELDNLQKLRKRVDFDLEYINRWSLGLDVEIIVRTLLLVFGDKAAY